MSEQKVRMGRKGKNRILQKKLRKKPCLENVTTNSHNPACQMYLIYMVGWAISSLLVFKPRCFRPHPLTFFPLLPSRPTANDLAASTPAASLFFSWVGAPRDLGEGSSPYWDGGGGGGIFITAGGGGGKEGRGNIQKKAENGETRVGCRGRKGSSFE